MERKPQEKPHRWETFLRWLTMLDKSPQEHVIDYLQQVETRLQRLERSLQQDRPGQ